MTARRTESILKHALMLLLAFFIPPIYFAVRKRFKVAIAVTVIMVLLANWNAYGPLFAMALSFVSALVQILVELYYYLMYTDEPEETAGVIVEGRLVPRPKK